MIGDGGPRTTSRILIAWTGVILLAAALYAVLLPMSLALGSDAPAALAGVRRGLTLLFAVDALANLFRLAGSARVPRFRSTPAWIALDLLAAVPLFFPASRIGIAVLGLAKLGTVARVLYGWRRRAIRYSGLLGLAFTGFWLVLVVHWVCSGWLALRTYDPARGLLANYVDSLYWAVATLTTVGYGDITPENTAQRVFAIGTMVVGLAFIGYMIGLMATFLAQRDPARLMYVENLDRLAIAVRHRSIPEELQRRILDYYGYVWRQRLGYDESEFLSSLPMSLREEVSLHMKNDVLERVELFRDADPEFVRYVAVRLRPEVLTPGDWAFREGQPGDRMYFIARGQVEVLKQGQSEPIASLGAGDFFGEIALFQDQPRSGSVRALSYCDVYSLSKTAFGQVLERFPSSVAEIEAMALSRHRRDTGPPAADEDPAPVRDAGLNR